jgi:hypothetical protein
LQLGNRKASQRVRIGSVKLAVLSKCRCLQAVMKQRPIPVPFRRDMEKNNVETG